MPTCNEVKGIIELLSAAVIVAIVGWVIYWFGYADGFKEGRNVK